MVVWANRCSVVEGYLKEARGNKFEDIYKMSMFMTNPCIQECPLIKGRNNFDGNESTSDVSELKEIGDAAFYVSTFLIGLIGIFCILGNGLVLYISRKNNAVHGKFQKLAHSLLPNFSFSALHHHGLAVNYEKHNFKKSKRQSL